MAKRKPDQGQLLPTNMSFLGGASRPQNGVGGKRRRSWAARIAIAYLRSAAIVSLLSLVPALVLIAVLWWATPAWMVVPLRLPEWRDIVDTGAFADWAQQAAEDLRNLAPPAMPAETPAAAPSETPALAPVTVATTDVGPTASEQPTQID